MRLGNLELHLLSDGQFRLDGGMVFGIVPKVLWEKVLPADELNRVPMALHCLLVVSEGKRILIETGYGDKLSPKQSEQFALWRPEGGLLDGLQRLGYTAEDIDIVINTHLHPDHCGGNTRLCDGVAVPTFPRAQYWIQRQEWADASFPNERTQPSYPPENWGPLQQAGQLSLISGDTRVTGEVRCMTTRGHTRAHQSVLIESAGQAAVFLGDLASKTIQLERLNWTTAFDTEPLETVEIKRAIRDWAWEKHALLIFGHDVRMPLGYLSKEGERFLVNAA